MNIYLYLGNDLFLKIFHTPEAVAIIFPLHSKSQTKKIIDFVFFEIVAVPKISSPSLVGAINRVVSFSRIYNKVPNLPETKVVLKDLLNLAENKVTIDLIQTIVCKFFKISKNEMLSSRRSRYLVRPRQTAIYLTKILTSKSLPEINITLLFFFN